MTATVVHDPLIQDDPVIPMDDSELFTFVVTVSVDYIDPQVDDPDATKGPVLSYQQVEDEVRVMIEDSLYSLPSYTRLEVPDPDDPSGDIVESDYEIQEAYVE